MRTLMLFLAAVPLSASMALAQEATPVRATRWADLTVGSAYVALPHDREETGAAGVSAGLTAHFSRRAGLAVSVDGSPQASVIAYRVAAWITLQEAESGRWAVFFTPGLSGGVRRYPARTYRYVPAPGGEPVEYRSSAWTDSSGLVYPTLGLGFDRQLTDRLVLRIDGRAVFCYYFDSVRPNLTASLVVPLGR